MWLVFQTERIQNRPSPSPYFGASLSRECFIRLIHVDNALVAAHELRDSNRNRDMVEKNPELFGLYRLREFLGVKQVVDLPCRLLGCLFLGRWHSGSSPVPSTRSVAVLDQNSVGVIFAYADGL